MARKISAVRPTGQTQALLYRRVSSTRQEAEGLSLPAQERSLREYSRAQGWVVAAEYVDVETGKHDDRAQYQRMLADARRLVQDGHSVSVAVVKLDRLGRRLLERVRSREELKSLGVETHSVLEGGKVSDLIANILGSVAEEEVRQLGERIKFVRTKVIESGNAYPNGGIPWGYYWRVSTKAERATGAASRVLEVNPAEVESVRQLFEHAREGWGLRTLSGWVSSLPEEARGGRTVVKEVSGELVSKVYKGRKINPSNVSKILRNPVYVGRPKAGDSDVLSRPLGRWPSLIEDQTWTAVQTVLDGRSMPHARGESYLLTGLIRCPTCNSPMVGHVTVTPRGRYRQYVCNSQVRGASATGERTNRRGRLPKGAEQTKRYCSVAVPADTVERVFISSLDWLFAAAEAMRNFPESEPSWRPVEEAWRSVTRPNDSTAMQIETLQREIRELEGQLTRGSLMVVKGAMSEEGYALVRQEIEPDLAGKRSALIRLRRALSADRGPTLQEAVATLSRISRASRALDSEEAVERSRVVETFRGADKDIIENIIPKRIGYGQYEVESRLTQQGEGLGAVATRLIELVSPPRVQ